MRIRSLDNDTTLLVVNAPTLEDADLGSAKLHRARLSGMSLRGANLQGADLRGADLEASDLQFANLADTLLMDARLARADLRAAILAGADLGNADLEGTVLQAAVYDTGTRWPDASAAWAAGAFSLTHASALALSRMYGYAKENGLALHAELYHDIPVFTLGWHTRPHTHEIQLALDSTLDPPTFTVTVKQWRSGPLNVHVGPMTWKSMGALPVGFGWGSLRQVLDAARAELSVELVAE